WKFCLQCIENQVMNRFLLAAFLSTISIVPTSILRAETGAQAWLRYTRLDAQASRVYDHLPSAEVTLGDSAVLRSSQQELVHGIQGMLGKSLRIERALPRDGAIILGSLSVVQTAIPGFRPPSDLGDEGFWLM